MKIAVTGAGGYIGSVLTEKLLKSGHSVWGIDRYFFGESIISDLIEHSRFTLVKNDIRNLKPRDLEGMDVVMDLAGLSNDPACDLDEDLTYSINFKGTVNVAKCAKAAGVGQYIFASSCSVYGHGKEDILTEKSPLNPVSCYAKSKVKSEEEIAKLTDRNFCVTFLRNATVYGLSRRMRFDLVVNLMTLIAWKKNKIYIMGGGKQWRPIVHLNDVAKAFITLLTEDRKKISGQIYNVGSNEQNYQVYALAHMVQGCFDNVELEVIPEDEDKRTYHVCFDKIAKELKFSPDETPIKAAQQIKKALQSGEVTETLSTKTVEFYKYLIEADKLLERIKLKGKLF